MRTQQEIEMELQRLNNEVDLSMRDRVRRNVLSAALNEIFRREAHEWLGDAAPVPAAMTAYERAAMEALLRYQYEDDMGESDERASEARNRMMILARAVRAERKAARAAEAAQHE